MKLLENQITLETNRAIVEISLSKTLQLLKVFKISLKTNLVSIKIFKFYSKNFQNQIRLSKHRDKSQTKQTSLTQTQPNKTGMLMFHQSFVCSMRSDGARDFITLQLGA